MKIVNIFPELFSSTFVYFLGTKVKNTVDVNSPFEKSTFNGLANGPVVISLKIQNKSC